MKIIPLEYDSISRLGDHLKVMQNGKLGVFDKEGNKLLPIKYSEILIHNSAGMFVVRDRKDNLNLINEKGRKLASDLKTVSIYVDGAVIGNGEKYGIVTNHVNTKFIYDSVPVGTYEKSTPKTRSYRRTSRHRGLIPTTGGRMKKIIVVNDGKAGMVDSANNIIIPLENNEVIRMKYKNYFTVKKGKKYGYFLNKCNK